MGGELIVGNFNRNSEWSEYLIEFFNSEINEISYFRIYAKSEDHAKKLLDMIKTSANVIGEID